MALVQATRAATTTTALERAALRVSAMIADAVAWRIERRAMRDESVKLRWDAARAASAEREAALVRAHLHGLR